MAEKTAEPGQDETRISGLYRESLEWAARSVSTAQRGESEAS